MLSSFDLRVKESRCVKPPKASWVTPESPSQGSEPLGRTQTPVVQARLLSFLLGARWGTR